MSLVMTDSSCSQHECEWKEVPDQDGRSMGYHTSPETISYYAGDVYKLAWQDAETIVRLIGQSSGRFFIPLTLLACSNYHGHLRQNSLTLLAREREWPVLRNLQVASPLPSHKRSSKPRDEAYPSQLDHWISFAAVV